MLPTQTFGVIQMAQFELNSLPCQRDTLARTVRGLSNSRATSLTDPRLVRHRLADFARPGDMVM